MRISFVAAIFIMFSSIATSVIPQVGRAQQVDLNALNQQVLRLYREGKYIKGAEVAERALAIAEKKLGNDHPQVATSLNNLALLYQDQGHYSKAAPLFKRSLAIAEKALGPNHPQVAASLNNLALLYKAQGRRAEAELLFKRSRAIRKKME